MTELDAIRAKIAALKPIRAKIAALKPEDRCALTCPTWAVFDTGGDYELQTCDECNAARKRLGQEPLLDEEVEALPEAQNELALANADGDAYIRPVAGPPCQTTSLGSVGAGPVKSIVCGSLLYRGCNTGGEGCLHCVVCGHGEGPKPVIDVSTAGGLEAWLDKHSLGLEVGRTQAQRGWYARLTRAGSGRSLLSMTGADLLAAIKAVVQAWEAQ